MSVSTTALDAPTMHVAPEPTVHLDRSSTQPVPVRHRALGYPAPRVYRVPPVAAPRTPAGSGAVGVPWGPPSGPLPIAPLPTGPFGPGPSHTGPFRAGPVPTMPRPAVPARRGLVAALAAAALALGLLVGGGLALSVGSADAPAEPAAVTWSGAVVGS